ncbi:MAG: hypothetical protein V1915_00040 [Candidatus Bathyarchaeota archaeon]
MSERRNEKNEQFLRKMKTLDLKKKPGNSESYILPNGKTGKIVWRSADGESVGVEVKESKKATVYLLKVESENVIVPV